jgi:hypothetical protein
MLAMGSIGTEYDVCFDDISTDKEAINLLGDFSSDKNTVLN